MGIFVSRLEWIKNKGKGDTQVIDNWKTINIRLGSELKNNNMAITLSNDFGKSSPREWNNDSGSVVGTRAFQIDDKFKLYCKYDSNNGGLDLDENSDDFVFFGDLREIKSNVDENKSTIELKCTDRTFNLLNRIGWANYSTSDTNAPNGQGWTAPLMVQDVVRQRSNTNKKATSKNQLTYDNEGHITPPGSANTEFLMIDARLFSAGGFIQDDRSVTITKQGTSVSRSIGTPDSDTTLFPSGPATTNKNFPFKNFTAVGKPIYELLSNLSQVDMTNTTDELDPDKTPTVIIKRAMRFYLDELNRLHWFYPTTTVDTDKLEVALNMEMGTTSPYEIKRHNLNYAVEEVINFIYFEAGIDMNGNTILGFRYDPTSGAPTIKDSKRSYPKIAEGMKQEDKLILDKSKSGGYSYPSTYPVVPKWNLKVTVNSDTEYNTEFKKEAIKKGNARADSIIKGSSSQRWKGTVETLFYNFTITDLIQYTSEAGGISKQKLRITDITHNLQKSAAFTTLTVEEDGTELEA